MATMYDFNEKRQVLFKQLCEKGIGWNVNYAPGTFDLPLDNPDKKFKDPKAKKLFNTIMGQYCHHVTVEGGKRGGKDVYALYSWANYLMICPNKLHLATGQTINHAIQTILEADGFGIRHLLPHGEKKMVDGRTVFIFMDFYGCIKEIHFFSGGEVNDCEKFRGFSYGSYYANEAINQHYNTIKEGVSRTNASKHRKIIHTQNPLAGEYEYYEKYEKPLIASDNEISEILECKNEYSKAYKINAYELSRNIKEATDKILKYYLNKFKDTIRSEEELVKNSKIYRQFIISKREAESIERKKYNDKYRLDFVKFDEYYDNPNGVKNGINFRYSHFTHDDNLSMTDLDREKIENGYDKTGVIFKREIRGIRASSDNAIWDTLTSRNILHGEIPATSQFTRYLVVDFGMKNDFVCIDCDVDRDFSCKIWKEYRFSGREQEQKGGIYLPPTTSMYVNEIKKMIQSRNNGKYVYVIVDPSASPLINELKVNGIPYKKAKNDVGQRREKEKPDKKIDKSIVGIWLVRDGFAKEKIKIHSSCIKGLNECYSYCFDPKKLAIGKEEPLKVNDHFPDCVRYLVNTVVKNVKNWSI